MSMFGGISKQPTGRVNGPAKPAMGGDASRSVPAKRAHTHKSSTTPMSSYDARFGKKKSTPNY